MAVSVSEEPVIGVCKRGHGISLINSGMALGEASSSKWSLNPDPSLTAVSTEAIRKYFFHLLCYI